MTALQLQWPNPSQADGVYRNSFWIPRKLQFCDSDEGLFIVLIDGYADRASYEAGKPAIGMETYTVTEVSNLSATTKDELYAAACVLIQLTHPKFTEAEIVEYEN